MFAVRTCCFALLLFGSFLNPVDGFGQTPETPDPEMILRKAVDFVGGERYLGAKNQVSRGKFSVIRDGAVISFQSFHDVIIFPDTERTEFKAGKIVTVQTNTGDSGWLFDGNMDAIRDQTEEQLANFRRGMRVSLDNLLRGHWRGKASLEYGGRRPASLGKRNDVLRLTYEDGFAVEFEIADDGTPMKAISKRMNNDGEEIVEEDRYAQFIDNDGIRSPFIIDRVTNGVQLSRINYQSVEFNTRVPESYFTKPATAKDLKKSLQL
ncbi:MAG: hypothetical protein IPM21_12275 [Acidobacteria bacterium]|nr:hypothetical protein [Acidobacteriota bacterium]